MNQRLLNIYDGFASKNREKFLTDNIELDAMWGKPIKGVTLQIDLSNEIRDSVCKLQNELFKLEHDALLPTPRPFQHISFNQVVYWGSKYTLGHEGTWASIEQDFLTKFHGLDTILSSFTISFVRLIPMTSAIVWCALDKNDEMQTLRATLKEKLPFPIETTKLNTFIHTTVARYKTKLHDSHRVFQLLENYQTPISMKVNEIILRKENLYPSLNTTELTRIRLQ